jgi:glycine/D-amino acid oxidase-like deaminating enzyme
VALDRDLLPVPVIHNYGHGGSGITISWGCAQDVADLVASRQAAESGLKPELRPAPALHLVHWRAPC